MKLRYRILFFTMFALSLGGGPVHPAQSPAVRLLTCDENKITVEYTFPPPYYETIPINGQLLEIPRIAELPINMVPGTPQLPHQTTALVIPPKAKVTLEIDYSEIGLPEIHHIAPVKNAFTGKYSADSPICGRADFFPNQWAKITAEGWMRGQRLMQITVYPVRYHPKTSETIALKSLRLTLRFSGTPPMAPSNQALSSGAFRVKSVLNEKYAARWRQNQLPAKSLQIQNFPLEKALKIPIQQAGIYQISYELLQSVGFEFDPTAFQLQAGGIPQPVVLLNASPKIFGPGDVFFFLGSPPQNDSSYFHPYTDTNWHWLTQTTSAPLLFQPDSVTAPPTKYIESVQKKYHFEKEKFYHHGDSNIDIYTTAQVPGEGWVWQFFYPGDAQTFPFALSHIKSDTTLARLTVKVHGMTLDPATPDHHARFEINGQTIGEIYFNDREDIRFQTTFSSPILQNGRNEFRVTSVGGTGASLDQFYMTGLNWRSCRSFPVKMKC